MGRWRPVDLPPALRTDSNEVLTKTVIDTKVSAMWIRTRFHDVMAASGRTLHRHNSSDLQIKLTADTRSDAGLPDLETIQGYKTIHLAVCMVATTGNKGPGLSVFKRRGLRESVCTG
jgi:hypothetical protein